MRLNVNYMCTIFGMWAVAFIIKIVLSYLTVVYSFSQSVEQDLLKLILVVVINLVTDIGPCISVLEIKFIDLFRKMRTEKLHLESISESDSNNHLS